VLCVGLAVRSGSAAAIYSRDLVCSGRTTVYCRGLFGVGLSADSFQVRAGLVFVAAPGLFIGLRRLGLSIVLLSVLRAGPDSHAAN